jgi:DNA-binding NarL/FixJ family response regulator
MLTTARRPSVSPILRVVIADALLMSRLTLRCVLAANEGCTVVGETFDGAGAVKLVRELRPHVLIVDLAIPRVLRALRQLVDSDTGVRPVVVAAAIRSEMVVTALTLGARGVLHKHVRPSALSACVKVVAQGFYWVGDERVGDAVDAYCRVRVDTPPLAGDALCWSSYMSSDSRSVLA